MNIVFRTDAALQIGTGHVMRCLTLAHALRKGGAECHFVCREHPGNLIELIRDNGFDVLALPPEEGGMKTDPAGDDPPKIKEDWVGAHWKSDAEATRASFGGEKPDWVIVDHYGLDRRWESTLRPHCRNLMVIDDLANRVHECDLLLDQNLYDNMKQRYKGLVPDHCLVMLGPKNMLLRPEFDSSLIKDMSEERYIPRRILIMFGGEDVSGHTLEAIGAVRAVAHGDTRVDVVIRAFNRHSESIAEVCERDGRFNVHVDSDAVAQIMGSTELAIGSGGISTYERLAMRIPSFLTIAADNQSEPLRALADSGLVMLYRGGLQLSALLATAFENGIVRPPTIVESGLERMSDALINRLVSLRHPSPSDVRRTFYWLQNSELRRSFLVRGTPTRRQHFSYWRRILGCADQHVWSVYYGAVHVGNAGIRNIQTNGFCAELWLYIGDIDMRGRRLGESTLAQLENFMSDKLNCSRAALHVARDNGPAISLYERSGYHYSIQQNIEETGFKKNANIERMEKAL